MRAIVYAPLALLSGGLAVAVYIRPEVQNLFNQPLWIAATTLVTALTELVDSSAMACVALRIVRVRQGGSEA